MLILFAAAAWLAAQFDGPDSSLSGTARAADGDTLVIAHDRIRMLGIDAPELAQVCWRANGAEWPCGKASHDRLAALINGKTLTCTGNERDKYQRLLATCAANKRDLGAVMVREGLAVADWEYKAEEIEARSKRTGIWGGRFDMPRAWRDAHGTRSSAPGLLDWFIEQF